MAKPKKDSNIKKIAIIVAVVIVGLMVLGIGWSTFGGKIMALIEPDDEGGGLNNTDVSNDKPPVAILTADKTRATRGSPVFFDGNESYDPGYSGNLSNKGIKFFIWDFGYTNEDGSRELVTTTNGTIDHSFPEARSYIVTLTVLDEIEQEDSAQINITVVPQDLPIGPISRVLIQQSTLPIQFNNMTEVNWTLEKGATSMNLSITISGGKLLDGVGPCKLEVYLEDPYLDIMENETLEVTGQKNIVWIFGPSDLRLDGMYNLVVRALDGSAYVSVTGSASYL